mgnify:CR=1 FL=1
MKKDKDKEIADLIKLLIEIMDERIKILIKYMFESNEISGCISNPKMGQEILSARQLEKDREEIKEEDFEDLWNEMKEFIPPSFHITGDDLGGDGSEQIDLERFHEYVADELEKNMGD